jgi:RNA polymerase sigma factor (sigma-70 family)
METPMIAPGRTPASGLPGRLALFGDERLARLVGNGRERAFAALYERYHQPLYRYCRSIVRDDTDAEDALQSTLASAFVALKRGQRDAPLRPWLFRIAHNEAISLIRRRAGTRELTDAPEQCVASAEDRAGERARFALLIADLRELPDRPRGALLMRELSGLSHEEIAIALETSVGAAKQAIFEARRALLEFGEGRSMHCEDVRRTVSDGDGRALRGRRVRAHLRDCALCSAFAAAIPSRREDLRAVVPVLAPAASAAMLARVIGAGSGHGAGGAGAVAAGAAGKTVGATLAAKVLAGTAVLVTAAAGVTGVHAILTKSRHVAARPPSAHNAGTPAAGGAAGRAVLPATSTRGSVAGGRAANGSHQNALRGRAASAGSSTSAHSTGRRSAGSAGAHGAAGASKALPAQAHGTPARSVAVWRRGAANRGVGRHSGGRPSSVPASGHRGNAGASHITSRSGSSGSHSPGGSGSRSPGGNGSHAATGTGAGSPPAGARATRGAPSAQAVVSVPANTTTTPAPSTSHTPSRGH